MVAGYDNSWRKVLAFVGLWLALCTLPCWAAARGKCADLPESRFDVYELRTPPVDERAVDTAELDQWTAKDQLSSRHTMMRTTHDVAMMFEVDHRIIPLADGQVCDAPTIVRMVIGIPKRIAYIARPAAEDACIRAAMLEHEAAHQRADAEGLRRLIAARQDYIVQTVAKLKHTPFPSREAAIAFWHAKLAEISEMVRQDFLAEEQQVNASVDTPTALRRIENGCGGKLEQIERSMPADL